LNEDDMSMEFEEDGEGLDYGDKTVKDQLTVNLGNLVEQKPDKALVSN